MAPALTKELPIMSFDGAWLSGTLTMPERPKGIVITVHGSFLQTRDGDVDSSRDWMFPEPCPRRKLFKDVRETLYTEGIGSYCYDKRGSGRSEGIYVRTDLDALAKDVQAVFHRIEKMYPDLPIGLIGQSEGTLTVPRAYELGIRPQCMVLQGPVVTPVRAIFEFQRDHAAAPFMNDPTGEMRKKFPFISATYKAFYEGDFFEKMENTKDETYTFHIDDSNNPGVSLNLFRQYDACNVKEIVKSARCPVAFIVGEKDQNTPSEPIVGLRDWFGKEAPHVSVYVLPGLEHSFRVLVPGDTFLDSMGKPISPKYPEVLRGFFRKHFLAA